MVEFSVRRVVQHLVARSLDMAHNLQAGAGNVDTKLVFKERRFLTQFFRVKTLQISTGQLNFFQSLVFGQDTQKYKNCRVYLDITACEKTPFYLSLVESIGHIIMHAFTL